MNGNMRDQVGGGTEQGSKALKLSKCNEITYEEGIYLEITSVISFFLSRRNLWLLCHLNRG